MANDLDLEKQSYEPPQILELDSAVAATKGTLKTFSDSGGHAGYQNP